MNDKSAGSIGDIGNEDMLAKVRAAAASELQKQAQLGGGLTEGELIDYTSSEGNSYKGIVVFKKPTAFEVLRMGAIKSEVLRNAGVQDIALIDDGVRFLAHVIGVLSIAAIKRPEWMLKLETVKELDVLYHVYDRYETWENTFRAKFQEKLISDSADAAGTQAVDTP